MKIKNDYPGANIKVIQQEKQRIKLEQDIRDSTMWWFYWNFCVEAPALGEIIFEFCNGEVIGPWGPAFSFDRIHWNWVGKESRISSSAFRYSFDGKEKEVRFCFSLPYQIQDFERFYTKHSHVKYLKREVLLTSEKGRMVPLLILGKSGAEKNIFFTCRHHACESVAGYVLEGLMEQIIEEKDKVMENYKIHVVPFIDIDGVEEGDQGKARAPHDHNRDYIEAPIYRSTAALMEYARDKSPEIFLDFHCPWKWGEGEKVSEQRNNHAFFLIRNIPMKEEIEKLSSILAEMTQNNPNTENVIYQSKFEISIGEEWFEFGLSTSASFFENLGARISTSFEYPYFGVGERPVTQRSSRAFGADIARSLIKYLQS